jgi:hypothetical protein
LVNHLTVEARRPPLWASGVHREQHSSRLRTALGALARVASWQWTTESTVRLVLRYEPDSRYPGQVNQAVLETAMAALDRAGLFPTSGVVSRVATHWIQGALAGAITGLGLSRTQEDRLQPAVAMAGMLIGALVGAFVRREVPIFRAVRLPATGWRLVPVEPEASAARFRVGLA